MDFEERLLEAIEKESKKISERYHAYHNAVHLSHKRKEDRLGIAFTDNKNLVQPEYWSEDRLFNPFYVHKKRRSIAKSIAKKIENGKYVPNDPFRKTIKKDDGGVREISVYQIPDAAVSKLIYKELLSKNKHRFSSYSYAYRDDRNVHFAIQDISLELKEYKRLYVAEYDFSKFFDSISHDYIRRELARNGLTVSAQEKKVIESFLQSREKGIPQGTSISLFLANVACCELDRGLEKKGVRFARYADDTVIWAESYSKINEAVAEIYGFSKSADVEINHGKSDGISLLSSEDVSSELASNKHKIDFLGYTICSNYVGIKEKSIFKIKRTISYILYKHLVQPYMVSGYAPSVPTAAGDEGLLGAISEIRRYLYGNMSDDMLRKYVSGLSGRISFKGVMSFYPLVDDEAQMKAMDGWLLCEIYKAVKKRRNLLRAMGAGYIRSGTIHHGLSRSGFASRLAGMSSFFKAPSFMLIYSAMQKAINEKGIEKIIRHSANEYNY